MSGMAGHMGDISWASLKAGYVLELGSFTGEGSTKAIQDGLAYHHTPLHITVDWEDNLVANRPKVPWWHMVVGDTRKQETLNEVQRITVESPGLIFIDTLHDYAQMQAELNLWQELANDATTWLMHDTNMYGVPNVEMVKAITEFADANGWRYEDYRQDSHGLGRMRR